MNKSKRPLKVSWIAIGLLLTAIYLIFCFEISSEGFWCLKLNEKADFLAGFLSPLAFLWLVFGYFQNNKAINIQAEALNLQTQELRASIDEMKTANSTSLNQLSSIQNTEALNKRDLFFKYYDIHKADMDALAKAICRHLCNSQFTQAIGKFNGESSFSPGLNDVHYMMFTAVKALNTKDIGDIKHIKRELEAYVGAFFSLQEYARKLDGSDGLLQMINQSSYGDFFRTCDKILLAYDEANSRNH